MISQGIFFEWRRTTAENEDLRMRSLRFKANTEGKVLDGVAVGSEREPNKDDVEAFARYAVRERLETAVIITSFGENR